MPSAPYDARAARRWWGPLRGDRRHASAGLPGAAARPPGHAEASRCDRSPRRRPLDEAAIAFRIRRRARPAPGGEMSLVEHLTELRRRLIISLLAVGAAATVLITVGYEPIIRVLIEPYCDALPEGR